MKRIICPMLCILMIAGLSGCLFHEAGEFLDPVEFFYPRKSTDFVYGSSDGVIGSEIREASGHVGDLKYLLPMYLRGPQDSVLRSPFPPGCKLEDIYEEGTTLYIQLSTEFAALHGTDLTLACAALARTCLTMTNYEHVSINAAGDTQTVSIVLDTDSVLLADLRAFKNTTEEES